MDWQIAVALAVMIPVIVLPVTFVWFLNFGGLASVLKRAKERRVIKAKVEVPTD